MAPLHSFVLLFLSLWLAYVNGVPQVTSPPALLATGAAGELSASSAPASSCGACIIVADVAGVVWYSEIFINTAATAQVQVGVGNGTRVTRTSFIQNEAQFTFNANAGTAAFGTTPLAVTTAGFDSVTTVAGATLTSPTAYNVFSAYTLTSDYLDNGICSTTTIVSTLPSAYSETLAAAPSGAVSLDIVGERAFINFLGFSTCAGGGENFVGTALAQVQNVTATETTTFSGIALAAMSTTLAATTNPSPKSKLPLRTTTLTEVLTTLTATLSGSSTVTPVSVGAPEIIVGSTTITPSVNPIPLPAIPANSTIFPGSSGIGTIGTIGTGGFVPTGTITPFIGSAPRWSSGVSLWASGLLVFLVAVGWIL